MTNEQSASIEQNAAESEVDSFRKDLGPFVVAAETTRMPMLFTNARETDRPIVFANDSFLELTGYNREEVLGQSFNFLIPGASAEGLAAIESLTIIPRTIQKSVLAAGTKASSGLPFLSARFTTTMGSWCSISSLWSISPSTGKSGTASDSS